MLRTLLIIGLLFIFFSVVCWILKFAWYACLILVLIGLISLVISTIKNNL